MKRKQLYHNIKCSRMLADIEENFKFIVALLFWNHKNLLLKAMISVQVFLGHCVASLTLYATWSTSQKKRGLALIALTGAMSTQVHHLQVSHRMSATELREYHCTCSYLERSRGLIWHRKKYLTLSVMRMSWWNHPHGKEFFAGCQEKCKIAMKISAVC